MDNNNLILAFVLSVLILVGFQYFYVKPQQEHMQQQVLVQKLATAPKASTPEATSTLRDRNDIIKDQTRVSLTSPELKGSINLKGGRIDDLSLVQYRETADVNSPQVTLLSPAGSAAPHNAEYAELGWLSDNASTPMPSSQTEWTADDKDLSPQHPLTLQWDNGQGLRFTRVIAVDDQFMFTITDSVTNNGTAPVKLYPYGLVSRQGNPVIRTSTVLHEGPLGVFGGTLEEVTYKKLIDAGKKAYESVGGWFGITDKYWLVALIPPQDETLAAEFVYDAAGKTDPNQGLFQTDFRGADIALTPGATAVHTVHMFAGAKRLRLLDTYGDKLNIPHLDRAIDFGWFYFLTKPFLYLLDYLGHTLGSFGIAILVFTVMLKLVTLPLSLKSNHSMARMKELQPEIKRLQERYAEDKVKQNQETMELFKREKVNPMSGCAPTLIQIPIFFALYKVLYVGIELRQAPFYGWIRDMSAPDPTSVFTLFGAIPWNPPTALHMGVWPILMGISMFMQQRLSPQPPDKSQARMFMFMPILFTYMLAQMPSGLVIYWTWSNLLSILQQWYIMKHDLRRKGKAGPARSK